MKIKVNDKGLQTLLQSAKLQHKEIMREAYTYFKKITPVQSGNAKRNTKLITAVPTKTTILADYAYAGRLDEGYSRQAADGMSEPTIQQIKKVILPNTIRKLNRG